MRESGFFREPGPAPARGAGPRVWLVALVLGAATTAAYWNSLETPFLAGDAPAIVEQAAPRSPEALGPVLPPPAGMAAAGRPLLTLSFALHHALGADSVRGYHVVNGVIHLLAGLTLFGLMRRTLQRPVLPERLHAAAGWIAAVAAGAWLLHPLQTAAVTPIESRAHVLAGWFYLLTLYGFVRATAADDVGAAGESRRRSWRWWAVAIAACFTGMATHPMTVTAPLLVLAYDRTFLAGGFGDALRVRWRIHAALASGWILLAVLLYQARTGDAYGTGTLAPGDYLVTQAYAIATYLKLAVWPSPLVFDYGPDFVVVLGDVWPQALLVTGLLAAGAELVWRRSPLGFAALWFFGILAPTSSLLPIPAHTVAEHRMYLPLAALVVVAVVALYQWRGRAGLVFATLVAAGYGWLTQLRNETYRSELALWRDTLAARPHNVRALHGLGMAHSTLEQHAEAVPLLEKLVRLERGRTPDFRPAVVRTRLGHHLVALGRADEALPHFEEALQRDSYHAPAHYHLGLALLQLGRPAIAQRHFREAARLDPTLVEAARELERLGQR